ncbi:dephospho-CoA kinase [Schaalia sp. ZJ405]|uniref:dephospho-CoA kinase n=1 Tax=Schaalia sp. ZJ405 TaxID=2709403 RepID=UPI0013EE144E|nr:dephospho-CoA kinase [Schaalia sp. ZJ405]QPK80492.1 dephospho-CoA kinase [Schaalia sp. ZJ405]
MATQEIGSILSRGAATAELLRPLPPAVHRGPSMVVGLTGGIGSGKSLVASRLRQRGARVVDADAISRELTAPGGEALERLASRFGSDIINEDGALDRKGLAARVFSDPQALEDINALMHPLIAQRAWTQLRATPDGVLAVYDLPLLVETNAADLFDAVIVVDAPVSLRLQRLADRGINHEDARQRMAQQATASQRRAVASIWIDNAGTIDDAHALIDAIDEQWLLTPVRPRTQAT